MVVKDFRLQSRSECHTHGGVCQVAENSAVQRAHRIGILRSCSQQPALCRSLQLQNRSASQWAVLLQGLSPLAMTPLRRGHGSFAGHSSLLRLKLLDEALGSCRPFCRRSIWRTSRFVVGTEISKLPPPCNIGPRIACRTVPPVARRNVVRREWH